MRNKKINLFKAATITWENNTDTQEKLKKLDGRKNFTFKRNKAEKELAIAYENYREIKGMTDKIPFNTKNLILFSARENLVNNIKAYRTVLKQTKELNNVNITIGKNTKSLQIKINSDLTNKKSIIFKTINELLSGVRKEREARKLVPVNKTVQDRFRKYSNKAFGSLHCELLGSDSMGFVHAKSGNIIKLQSAKLIKRIFESKLPRSSEKHVGIEIEFFTAASQSLIAEKLVDINQYLCLKSDGSIRPKAGMQGSELVICVPESKREEIVTKVCAVLNELKCEVNGSCGLHVHLDMRNRNHSMAFNNLVTSQNILYSMNPKSRATGQFSKKNPTKDFNDQVRNSPSVRYLGVNPLAYAKYKTLEVRLHASSTNGIKINNWVTILNHIADKEEEIKRATESVEKFVKTFEIPTNMVAYIEERIKLFENTDEVEAA